MIFYWRIIDSLRKRKTIVEQFVIDNKIATIYVLKKDYKKFRVSIGLRKYIFSFENNKTNAPKKISYRLRHFLMYQKDTSNVWDNWQWLIISYNGTGHLNDRLEINIPIPEWCES